MHGQWRRRSRGRESAILGVSPEIDINLLKKAVYDQTDPKITPVFEELIVPEGTGRLLIMQIYPGMPPYTDSAGRGLIRVGKDCQPLTGTLRRIDWEAAKTRVLSILMERTRRNEPGLSNKEIRQITRFDRHQVYRLMAELRQENPGLKAPGRGKYARHEFKQ